MTGTPRDENLHYALAVTRNLRERFAHTAPRLWDPATAAAELAVQTGHLASCLLRACGGKVAAFEDPQRPLTSVGDELADVLLAALSIAVLADAELDTVAASPDLPCASDDLEAFLQLLVTGGALCEAALVEHGYRHRPTGTPASLASAATAVIASCEHLAAHLGLDVYAEFQAMAADATAFLDQTEPVR